eukprot:scaffold63856_cov14-Tisochrysis_lutea.AAC.1
MDVCVCSVRYEGPTLDVCIPPAPNQIATSTDPFQCAQEFWQLVSSRALARNLFLKYCRAK